MTAVILQFIATFATAAATVLAFGKIKQGRRFTRLGRMLLIAIGIGTLSSAGALIVGNISEEKRRESETLEAIERTELVVEEIRRTLYLLDDLKATFSFTVPDQSPDIAPYFERMSQGLDSALSQGYPFTDARGIGVVFNFEPPVVGFRPNSRWGPTQPGEETAMSILNTSAVTVLFFDGSQRDPTAEPDPSLQHRDADLIVGGSTQNPRLINGRHRSPQLLVYSHGLKELAVRAAPPIELAQINHVASGRIVSFLDLPGTEMHVLFESGPRLADIDGNVHRDELDRAFHLEAFGLQGRGIGFSLTGEHFEVHPYHRGRLCFVYRFPEDPDEFLLGTTSD